MTCGECKRGEVVSGRPGTVCCTAPIPDCAMYDLPEGGSFNTYISAFHVASLCPCFERKEEK